MKNGKVKERHCKELFWLLESVENSAFQLPALRHTWCRERSDHVVIRNMESSTDVVLLFFFTGLSKEKYLLLPIIIIKNAKFAKHILLFPRSMLLA